MADVERHVSTIFDIDAAGAVGKLGSVGGAFEGLGSLVTKVTSMFNPLNMAIGAIGAGLTGGAVMKAGSEFENLQIGLAQTLQFMGQGGKNFEDALANSAITMKRIVADAGPLPGNAMDYASALQIAGTVANRATGDFQKTYDLVKKTTAVSISMGGGAALGASELTRMLNAGQGMMHNIGDFNMKMLNAMRQLPGQANLTAAGFNKMELGKRLDIVNRAMGQFDDMIKASSGTWDAVKGAIEASGSLLVKTATAPLFQGAKNAMSALNSAIIDANGNLAPMGQWIANAGVAISNGLVAGVQKSVDFAKGLYEQFDRLAKSPLFAKAADLAAVLGGIGMGAVVGKYGGLVGAGAGAAANAAGAGAGPMGDIMKIVAVMTPIGAVMSGFIDAIQRAGVATHLLDDLGTVAALLTVPLGSLANVASEVSTLIGDIFAGALGGFMDMVMAVAGPLVSFADGLFTIVGALYGQVEPAFAALWTAVGGLFHAIGDFLGPVLSVLGGIVLFVANNLANVLAPVITKVYDALAAFITGIGKLLSWLGKLIGDAGKNLGISLPAAAPGSPGSALSDFLGKLKNLGAGGPGGALGQMVPGGARAGLGGAPAPEHRGGGGRAVQDFRYSRFEIQQKFAEGFDPDRIAVAFASDVGKIGERKLQSGFEPMYGVGGH